MRRPLLALLLLGSTLSAARGDALILKDGRKVIGRVTEKKDHYDVQVEGTSLTFDKDEVQQWIKSPKEVTGDVDRLVDEAKKLYTEAVEIKDEKAAEGKFREALPKVTKARELLTEAREFFPEGYTELDAQLVTVMKLMRLVRERLTSKIASAGPAVAPAPEPPKPEPKPEPKVEAPPEFGLKQAWAILGDTARRGDEKQRAQARAFFKGSIDQTSVMADLATTAQALLSKTDAEWKLPVEAFQAFFKAVPGDKVEILSEKEIEEGVTWLALKSKEERGKAGPGSFDPLLLLAAGVSSSLIEKNLGKSPPGLDAALKDFALEKSEFGAVWGRKDGLAMDDYRKWAASGEYALAVVQFQKDYATLPELGPKYAFGLLSTFRAIHDNRNYNKAAVVFEILARSAPPAARDHALALAKSIRDESPCAVCGGTHKVNCNICRGKTKFNAECGKCGGSGKINSMRGIIACPNCKGQGIFRDVKCEKCKETGKIECKARGCTREVKPPTFASFADTVRCTTCDGKGTLTRHIALACPDCLGIGLLLRPKSDPSKLIR